MQTIRVMALMFAVSGVVATVPAAAQARPGAFRGPALELYGVRSPAWRAELQDPLRNTQEIPATGGLGLSFAWAITPNLATFVAGDFSLYGESGFTTVTAGVEGRLPLGGPVMPRATIGVGRLSSSGGIGYDYLQLGGGADLFVLQRLALRAELEQQIRLGDGRGGQGRTGPEGPIPTVPAVITGGGPRVSIGVVWYMGSRGRGVVTP